MIKSRILCHIFARDMIDDVYKYNSVDVALFIAAKANEAKIGINLTKIQKLLYIAYGAHLAVYNERLLNEHPQAWPYGPVFPTTRKKIMNLDLDDEKISDSKFKKLGFINDTMLNSLIDFVFRGFAKKTAAQLTIWSHQPNSPWDEVTRQENFKWGQQIPDILIRDYFKKIININESNG